MPDAKTIGTEADATDLRLTDGALFFRTGAKVIRAAKDGSGRALAFESSDLVHAFVADGGTIVAIEQPDGPNALVRVVTADSGADEVLAATAVPTNWDAAGSYFFAADAKAFYAVADVPNQGEIVYALPRATPLAMIPLAQANDVISSPQLGDGAVWFVRDRKRVFKVELEQPAPSASEVFGIGYAACALAVGSDAAFCSAGATLEQRDLSGGSPKTLLEAAKSKVAAPFGSAIWADGTLYVRADAADAKMGYTIRAIKATSAGVEERIVACGRGAIGAMAVDGDTIAWTESGKGVFVAPR